MIDYGCAREKFNPMKKFVSLIKYKRAFYRNHPNYFDPDGLVVFVGAQGTGKTLSAVNYVYNLLLKFPHAIIVTNIMLEEYPIVTFDDFLHSNWDDLDVIKILNGLHPMISYNDAFRCYLEMNRVFPFNDQDDLKRYSNGELGVIYLVDEIQLYFNSLESKNINMEVMVQISQQRKQRKHIICTSQVFGRMAKPLREQFSNVVVCHNYFKMLQINKLIDRDSICESSSNSQEMEGVAKRKFFYLHSPLYYSRYDTYYTIDKSKFVSNEKKVGDIYGTNIELQPSI